jgi:hypothetical protein
MREKKVKQFKIFLTESEHKRLFELAEENHMSASEYVRFILLYPETIYNPKLKEIKEEKVYSNEK